MGLKKRRDTSLRQRARDKRKSSVKSGDGSVNYRDTVISRWGTTTVLVPLESLHSNLE